MRRDAERQLTMDDLTSIDLPVHRETGDASRASVMGIVDLLSERLPRSDLTVIPGAEHMAAVMRPDLFIPAITAWLCPRLAK